MNKSIVTTDKKSKKTRLQKQYEKLLEDIKQSKELKQSLEEDIQKVMPMIQKSIFPLIKQRNELFKKRLLRLDELSHEIGLGKHNREAFEEFMYDEIRALLLEVGFADAELRELSKRYSNGNDTDLIVQMIKQVTGEEIEVEEAIRMGLDEYSMQNQELLKEQMAAAKENKEREELVNFDPNAIKKTTKEEYLIAQDAKAIYMRLVKKFHPDLEQDEKLKIEKTALVQQITNAYKEKNFLELLKLEIECLDEKENEGTILADDMLKRYNNTLKRQLDEVLENIDSIKQSSMGLYQIFFDNNRKFSLRRFNIYKKNIKKEITQLEQEIRLSNQDESSWFKYWLELIKNHRN